MFDKLIGKLLMGHDCHSNHTHLDKQQAEASTVDNDRIKIRSRCLTAWLSFEGRIIGSNALKMNPDMVSIVD